MTHAHVTKAIRPVIICGQSIFANALQAALLENESFIVMRFHPYLPAVVERIVALEPAVVLLERERQQSDLALALLDQGVPLITLDVNTSGGTLLTGRYIPLTSPADLAQVVAQIVSVSIS